MIKPLPSRGFATLSKGEGLNSCVLNYTFLSSVELFISNYFNWHYFLFHALEHFP